MKRLTRKDRYWAEDEFWYDALEPDVEEIDEVYKRLAKIEDILGDEYDIDHIHISEPPDGKKGWDKDGKSRRDTKL